MMRSIMAFLAILAAAGCGMVRQQDLDAWVGAPVSELDLHPVFATMPVVKTVAADGTEMRNYVNGDTIASCAGSGSAAGYVNTASYSAFSSCASRRRACNNIFYIKNGLVTGYVPTGSGGAFCYTDSTTQPGFRGTSSFR